MIRDRIAPVFPVEPSADERRGPSAFNPLAAWAVCQTVVVPDLEAAIRFYRDRFAFALVEQSAKVAGSDFALMQAFGADGEGGLVRLVAAPSTALSMHRRPSQDRLSAGLARYVIATADIERVRDLAGAQQSHGYAFGPAQRPWTSGQAFAISGPADEPLIIDCRYAPSRFQQAAAVAVESFGPILIGFDRWPVLRFYADLLGLAPTSDRHALQHGLERIVGSPAGTSFRILAFAGMRLFEFRHIRPSDAPVRHVDPAKPGLASITLAVDDLERVRASAAALRLPVTAPLSALPGYRNGFTVRGSLGEMLEIVERQAS